jgi:hypothetical protein
MQKPGKVRTICERFSFSRITSVALEETCIDETCIDETRMG